MKRKNSQIEFLSLSFLPAARPRPQPSQAFLSRRSSFVIFLYCCSILLMDHSNINQKPKNKAIEIIKSSEVKYIV